MLDLYVTGFGLCGTDSFVTWLVHMRHDSFIRDIIQGMLFVYIHVYIYTYVFKCYTRKKKHVMMWHVTHTQREFESSFQFKWDTRLIWEGDSINKRGRLDSNSLGWTPGSFIWGTWLKLSRLNKYPMSVSRVKVMNIRGTKSVHTYEVWPVNIENPYIHMTSSYQKSVHTYQAWLVRLIWTRPRSHMTMYEASYVHTANEDIPYSRMTIYDSWVICDMTSS